MNGRESEAARRHNREAWNQLVAEGNRFTRPARDRQLEQPLTSVDSVGWLGGDIRNLAVLCLAAGGGKHSVIYASAGARVTVVDLSPAMLELDRKVASDQALDIRTVETSMDDLSMFAAGDFDVVIHPVSTCYLPDVGAVYREVARVTRLGGVYISQHKQPASLQSSVSADGQGRYTILEPYYRTGPLPAAPPSPLREAGTWEFLHRWEQLVGQMCRCGFVIEDLLEPCHARPEEAAGQFGHRGHFIPPYVRIKARRIDRSVRDGKRSPIWLPTA